MKMHYVGTKIVIALTMTRLAYNEYRGWALPADENGEDPGYLVEYTDGGAPNHPDHAGYISWSPKEQFDAAYMAIGGVDHLQPHEQHMIAECTQLNERLEKLAAVMASEAFQAVDPAESARLIAQRQAMSSYLSIIGERLTAINLATAAVTG